MKIEFSFVIFMHDTKKTKKEKKKEAAANAA